VVRVEDIVHYPKGYHLDLKMNILHSLILKSHLTLIISKYDHEFTTGLTRIKAFKYRLFVFHLFEFTLFKDKNDIS
jgi:hypothetical protein